MDDELMKEFVPEDSVQNSEECVYIGSIRDEKVILIFGKKVVHEKAIKKVLSFKRKLMQSNDIYYSYEIEEPVGIHMRVIYPAAEKHIEKFLTKKVYVKESYKDYLKHMSSGDHVESDWMDNILRSTQKDADEKIIYSDEEAVVVPDYKWDMQSTDNIHLLMIFRDKKLRTIRDINDYRVLVRAQKKLNAILSTFNIKVEDVFPFFHYRPTYYRLHLHILGTGACNEDTASAVRAISLYDIIRNLKMDPKYYKKDMFMFTGKGVHSKNN